jgi:hypothetical protein
MSINNIKKSRGRPRVDSEAVLVRLERKQLDALDAMGAEKEPAQSRPESIRQILGEFLKRHGFLK